MLSRLMLATVAGMAFWATTASATEIVGSAAFSDLTNSSVDLKATPNPALFDYNLSASGPNSSKTVNSFMTLNFTQLQNYKSDNVQLAFTFTLPSGISGQTDPGTVTFDVGWWNTLNGAMLVWNGSTNKTAFGYIEDIYNYGNGGKIAIDVYNVAFDTADCGPGLNPGDLKVVFRDPADPTPTPEPASMALLGTGLLGVGMVVGRRRHNKQAV